MTETPVKRKKHPLKGKGGAVAMGLLALLCVWLYFDLKKPVREPDSNPPVAEFVHLTASDVTRVEVKRPKDGFVLVRRGDDWMFEAPRRFRANPTQVQNWLTGLLDNATVSQVVEGRPDESVSGLGRPALEVVLTARGGETRTLQVGKDFRPPGQTGTGNVYYARELRDGRIFMLGSFTVDDIRNKKIDDLRDKRLLVFESEKAVRKISIRRAAGVTETERRGEDRWELVQPFRAPAEKFDVENLVSQLKTAEAESFAAENVTDLAKYGLDRPRLTVTVTDNRGTHTVLFGKAQKDGKVFALREGETDVLLVSKWTFESLDKKPADLRERRLITLEGEQIRTIELKNPHGTVRFQKVSGNEWQFADASDPKERKAKADQVQRIIDTIRAPAFKHVAEAPADWAKYGLDRPPITVTVSDGRGTSQVFMIGGKAPQGNYYARGVPNAVFEVQTYVYADLNVKRDAFKDTGASR